MVTKDVSALEEQYQCIIPDKRVRIWEIQMEMWKEFDRICKKHKLQYFFFYGSLLGAVRHRGFVPWDDDIDVVMPRDSYDRFSELAEEELMVGHYYVQTARSNGDANYFIMAMIDEETTRVNMNCQTIHNHQGISLDIIPLDGCPEIRWKRQMQILTHELFRAFMNNYHMTWKQLNFKKKCVKLAAAILFLFFPYSKAPALLERIRSKYKWEKEEMVVEFAHGIRMPKEWFSEALELSFEGRKVPVPRDYEKVLEELYGDFMQMPDQIQRVVSESDLAGWYTDPDISYKKYMSIRYQSRRNFQSEIYHNYIDEKKGKI